MRLLAIALNNMVDPALPVLATTIFFCRENRTLDIRLVRSLLKLPILLSSYALLAFNPEYGRIDPKFVSYFVEHKSIPNKHSDCR